MVKIIVAGILVLSSFFIYAKGASPLLAKFKPLQSEQLFLARQIGGYKEQINQLETVKTTNVALKKQKSSTYIFTLLSFVRYMRSEGLRVNIKLKPASGTVSPAINGKSGLSPYLANTKFLGVKKISVTLTFNGQPDIDTVLSVMHKIYVLFPVSFTGFKLDKKIIKINFNLYSFKGV